MVLLRKLKNMFKVMKMAIKSSSYSAGILGIKPSMEKRIYYDNNQNRKNHKFPLSYKLTGRIFVSCKLKLWKHFFLFNDCE